MLHIHVHLLNLTWHCFKRLQSYGRTKFPSVHMCTLYKNSNPLSMVLCRIFETQIQAFVFVEKQTNWASYSISERFIIKVNIYFILHKIDKQVSPVVPFLPVTTVHKQEELSIYF